MHVPDKKVLKEPAFGIVYGNAILLQSLLKSIWRRDSRLSHFRSIALFARSLVTNEENIAVLETCFDGTNVHVVCQSDVFIKSMQVTDFAIVKHSFMCISCTKQ